MVEADLAKDGVSPRREEWNFDEVPGLCLQAEHLYRVQWPLTVIPTTGYEDLVI